MPDEKPTVDEIVNDYVSKAKVSADEYAVLAKNAAKRLAGEEPGPASSWADDAAAFWGRAARDQALFLKMVSDLFQAATPTSTKQPPP